MATSARQSMVVAVPFITYAAAVWFRRQLAEDVELVTLTTIKADAVASSALDVTALVHFAELSDKAQVFALPNLHAKVFIADEKAAIVTSGNLTQAGLDTNLEYGVMLREPLLVRTIRNDMNSFVRLGNQVSRRALGELASLEADLRQARKKADDDAELGPRARFRTIMRSARPRFVGAQVGSRSANSVFGEAIRFVLARGPQPTTAIHEEVSRLLPDLCDDSEELVINSEHYGKAWKHRVRNAQQYLKRKGAVTYYADTKTWGLK
ncbi:phospholipase D-like domain-containing protein [Candidatus Palauibacter sp.]|uniref:phospholipase D-like domain-containing protein n=1 Tax=Candidatus Palauibacter sp. TaxID=3101350 RepID=UPI003AF2189E